MRAFLALALVGSAAAVMPQCNNNYVKNPFTEVCGCNEQVFTQANCTEAFWCADTVTNTGCRLTCGDDQLVMFDFATGEMMCDDLSNHPDSRCPGNFKLNCPNEDIGSDFSPSEDCAWCPNGGFQMSADCSEAMSCYTLLFPEPGRTLKCNPGYRVAVDFYSLEWECVPDDGQCPGLGGFRLGCPDDIPPNPDPVEAENPFGTCGCDTQFFSNDDCTQGFFCDETLGANMGKWWECREDQIIRPNFEQKNVICINRVEGQQCPGSFNVECEDIVLDPNNCECDGQLWMNSDCTQGFSCYSRMGGGGISLSCPEGEALNIDVTAYSYDCVQDLSHCPGLGGFTLGNCDGSWQGTIPPPATTTTTAGSGGSEKVLSASLLAAVMILKAL